MTALLGVALCLVAAGPASAAQDGEVVVSVDQPDSVGVVRTAQSDGGTDTEPGTERRLVGRESGERVDGVVIALWTIAGVMTVMLGIFLWHTSPRRRLRLAGASAAGRGSTGKVSVVRLWERVMARLGLQDGRLHDAESVDDGSEQRFGAESDDEPEVRKLGEKDGEDRSV